MRSIQRSVLDARRWLSLFLVCCFILCGIGGIHQRAQAIVGVDDAVIGIVIAALAAAGITFVSSGAYGSLTEYVGTLMDQYARSNGFTAGELFNGTQYGANSVGQLLINSRFVALIQGFGAWLVATYQLVNNSNKSMVASGDFLGSYTAYALPITLEAKKVAGSGGGTWEYVTLTSTEPVICVMSYKTSGTKRSLYPIFISAAAATVQMQEWNGVGTLVGTYSRTLAQNNSALYWNEFGSGHVYIGTDVGQVNMSNYDLYSYNSVISALTVEEEITNSPIDVDIRTGSIILPADDLDYTSGDGAVIDVAAPWGMTYPDIMSKWLPKEWAPGMSGAPTMTYEGETAVGNQVQTGPETDYVSDDPGQYAVSGLQSVFPFCIPFDIYNLLSALAADPVAPAFTWRFYVPGIADENISVDLSPFDTVAQIVRTVELLAFVVGLALVTRERFLRG